MKTISKRFLKASLAMLLVVIMLLSSTITGFATSVDNADTKANVDVAKTGANITSDGNARLYFNMNALSWWKIDNGKANFAYFFTEDKKQNAWSTSAVQYSGDTYYFTIPKGTWYYFILTRDKDRNPDWDIHNQTKDLELSSDSNYLQIFNDSNTSVTWGTAIKPTSTASLSASTTSVNTNTDVTLTPSLTSNTTYNEIKSTSYSISPTTGASVDGNTFKATDAGTYTVTATITYNPRGYSSLTSTATATTTITVNPSDYTVKVQADNGGSIVSPTSDATVAPKNSVNIEAKAYDANGYEFDYWKVESGTGDFGNDKSANTTFTPTSNATIKAYFKYKTYNVKLVEIGGNNKTASIAPTVTHNSTLNVIITAPDNYLIGKVEGAGLPAAAGTSYYYNQTSAPITSAEMAIITVTYIPKTVKYRFLGNTDDVVIKDWTTISAGEKPVAPDESEIPEIEGMYFYGWDPEVNAITSDTTYRAIYKDYEYTVTFKDWDDETLKTETVTYGKNATPPADPERKGYTFDGWEGNYTNIKADTTIKAKYKINSYKVTLKSEYSDNGVDYVEGTKGGSVSMNAGGEMFTTFPQSIKYGTNITAKASPNTDYRFVGWFTPEGQPFNSEFELADSDVTAVARFIAQYTVDTGKIDRSKIQSFTFNSTPPVVSTKGDVYTVDAGSSIVVNLVTNPGYRFNYWIVNNEQTDNTTTTYSTVVTEKMMLDANIVSLYNVMYKDEVVGSYAAGDPVTYTFPVIDTEYLIYADAQGAESSKTDLDTYVITFTMPDHEVVLTTEYKDYVYVTLADKIATALEISGDTKCKVGQKATVTVSPKAANISIVSITASVEGAVVTKNSNGTFTVVMNQVPENGVVIDGEINAKFLMEKDIEVIDNFSDKVPGCCDVIISADDYKDGYVSYGSKVTYTAVEGRSGDIEYMFDGFYRDSQYTDLVSKNTTYSFNAEDHTKLYARFVRKVFIYGSVAKGESKLVPMTYNFADNKYYYTTDIDYGTFYITEKASLGISDGWKKSTLSGSGITCARESTNNSSSKGKLSNLQSKYTYPITITFDNSTTYKVQATATKAEQTIYLSSGREDYDRNGKAFFSAFTEYVNYEGKYIVGSTNYDPDNESYTKAYLSKDIKTIDVQTSLSGTNAGLYVVGRYLVYDVKTKESFAVDAVSIGNNVYRAKIDITGSSYIVPIFFANDNYAASVDGKAVEITVDMTEAISGWGPFLSCYPYGTVEGSTDPFNFTGGWPGQLMTPIARGSNIYTTRVIIGKEEKLQGLVFANYLSTTGGTDKTAATFLKGDFGLSNTFYQTYDYKEPVYLHQADYDVITFAMKQNKDGYHGNTDLSASSVNAKTGGYKYEDLRNRNGELMDLYGNAIPADSTNTNEYYVIAKGDVFYHPAGNYKPDKEYTGKWSVQWYIYNKQGEYLAYVLSGSYYDHTNGTANNNQSVLIEHLINDAKQTEAQIRGAKVHISYEAANASNHSYNSSDYTRVDGQWYGTRSSDDITAQVVVGIDDGTEFIINENEPLNRDDSYGYSYISGKSGAPVQKEVYNLKDDGKYGLVDVQVNAQAYSPNGNLHKFKGYYIFENNEYKFQTASSSGVIQIKENTTIYAIFEEVAHDALTVTHQIYTNVNDREIYSHDGKGNRIIEIWECNENGDVIGTEPLATNSDLTSATVAVEAYDGKSYKIIVKVDVTAPDYFYAWYMDADTIGEYATYEEVFTEEEQYGENGLIESSFVYTYTEGKSALFTIYSDVYDFNAEARLVYTYKNRDDKDRTIIKTYDMSDQEILGCLGNGNVPMRPLYKQYKTLFNDETGESINVYDEDISKYEAQGFTWDDVSVGSNIMEKAPNPGVTEAFGRKIEWSDDISCLEFPEKDPTTIKIDAKSGPVTYTVTAKVDGETYTYENRPYNDLINDLVAPIKNKEGKTFSYWMDEDTKEVLSYSRYYYYRIVTDRNIIAMYDMPVDAAWTPVIEEVTYTREYQDASDYVYTDYHIAFHSRDKLEIEKLKNQKVVVDGKEVSMVHSYGLILMRDPKYNITAEDADDNPDNGVIKYPDYEGIEKDVRTVVESGSKQTISGHNAYYFEFSDEKTTNLNRIHHYIRYNNRHTSNYRTYAFSAYAFLRMYDENGELHTYISNSKNVDFFNLGSEDPGKS